MSRITIIILMLFANNFVFASTDSLITRLENAKKYNPMDMDAVMKIANMATEIGNWALEWAKLYECGNDEGFQNRYESITAKIDEVNK